MKEFALQIDITGGLGSGKEFHARQLAREFDRRKVRLELERPGEPILEEGPSEDEADVIIRTHNNPQNDRVTVIPVFDVSGRLQRG